MKECILERHEEEDNKIFETVDKENELVICFLLKAEKSPKNPVYKSTQPQNKINSENLLYLDLFATQKKNDIVIKKL
jgi:hypothetical protein